MKNFKFLTGVLCMSACINNTNLSPCDPTIDVCSDSPGVTPSLCEGTFNFFLVYQPPGTCRQDVLPETGYVTLRKDPNGFKATSNLSGRPVVADVLDSGDSCTFQVSFAGQGLFPYGVYDYRYDFTVTVNAIGFTGGGQTTDIFHWSDGSTHDSCNQSFELFRL